MDIKSIIENSQAAAFQQTMNARIVRSICEKLSIYKLILADRMTKQHEAD